MEHNKGGKISIVVPCYNCGKTILKTLSSLLQYEKDIDEIIVVDDGSHKPVKNIIDTRKNFVKKIKVIRNKKNKGPSYSRNIGVKRAKGDIIIFVDSDVEVVEGFGFLKNLKEYDAVCGVFSEATKYRSFFSYYKNFWMRFNIKKGFSTLFFTSIASIRKNVFEHVAGFDKKTKFVEDLEFGQRLSSSGYKIFVDDRIKVNHLKEYDIWGLLKSDMKRAEWTLFVIINNMEKDITIHDTSNPTDLRASLLFSLLFFPLSFSIIPYFLGTAFFRNRFLNYLYKRSDFSFAIASSFFLPLHIWFITLGVYKGVVKNLNKLFSLFLRKFF